MMALPYGKQATTSEQKAKEARDDATRAPAEQSEIQVCDSILDLGHRRLHRTTRKNRLGELLREQNNVPLREMSLVWPAYQSCLKYEATLERNDDASRTWH